MKCLHALPNIKKYSYDMKGSFLYVFVVSSKNQTFYKRKIQPIYKRLLLNHLAVYLWLSSWKIRLSKHLDAGHKISENSVLFSSGYF